MNASEKTPSFDEGLTAQMRGDFDSAIAIFERVVEEKPTSTPAHHQMGRCHMKLGNFAKAIECLETTVRLGPDRIAARLDLGMLHLAVRNIPKAKAQFLRALGLNSSNVKAMSGLGIVHYHEKDFGKAISQLQDACALNPSNFACHYYLAKIHRDLKNPAGVREEALKAAAICQGLIRTRSEQPEGYFFLGETLVLQEEFRPALQNYLIAKDFSPKDVLQFFAFGLHYTLVDNYLGIARCYKVLGENRYARYFGQLTLKVDSYNEEAKQFAAIED
ncbi:MAG: tetratricopeptide repeat protein [Candidatus Hydrogenedentota bacterium]|nr:MAG: tetratricopeptide repeat protein [Candidatus Hydrogenedentota bacterium]